MSSPDPPATAALKQGIEFQGPAADSWRASLILQAEGLADDHEAVPDDNS